METALLPNINFAGIIKTFVLFGLLIYLVFALVVIRQVQLMIKTLVVSHEVLIKIIAYGHFLFAIGVLLLAFLIL